MSFATELKAAVKTVDESLNKTWKESVVQLFTGTVVMTPVDKGIAIRGWLFGQNNANNVGTSRFEIKTSDIPDVGGTILLYNNVEYVPYLEEGTSRQKAVGMVATNVRRWRKIVRANSL